MASNFNQVSKKRVYRPEWLNDPSFRSWLCIKDESEAKSPRLACSICLKAGEHNIFTSSTGCTEYQRSAFTKHQTTQSHTRGLETIKNRARFQVAFKKQEVKSQDNLVNQMRSVYFIAQKHLPLSLYNDLCDLQKSNGATNMANTYRSHEPVSDMIESIASAMDDDLRKDIKDSKYLGVMTDESIDIAVLKKLVLYIKIVKDGLSKVLFVANVTVQDGKAETILTAITNWLTQNDIDVINVMALGSDGAAVMMGVRSGVGVRLKSLNAMLIHIHCYAHRLALAVSQAANAVEKVKSYQETVSSIYFYFHNSAQRYNKLREIYNLLEDEELICLKQPHAVRWLSLHQAVEAIYKCWPALTMALGQEAATGNATAKGLSTKVDEFSFIGLTCLLFDVMPNFTRLSKTFQRDSLDFAVATTALENIKATLRTMQDDNQQQYSLPSLHELITSTDVDSKYRETTVKHCLQGKMSMNASKRNFFINLLDNLAQRFPEDTQRVMMALDKILNPQGYTRIPAQTIAQFAQEELNLLLDHFAPLAELDPGRCRADFLAFKHLLVSNAGMNLAESCRKLIVGHADDFPDYIVFAKIALVVPLNSASCERGFSAQNRIKSKSRNRLDDDQVDRLMKISVNGPHFAEYDFTSAKIHFRNMKQRQA